MSRNLGAASLGQGEYVWQSISPKQVLLNIVGSLSWVIWLILPGLVMGIFVDPAGYLLMIPGIIIYVWYLILLPRRVRSIQYMLREDDLVLRSGIMFQKMTAVPYGRMQVVDITGGPLERKMGLSKLRMSTASMTANVKVPGLTIAEAEQLRDHLVTVAESRRAGL